MKQFLKRVQILICFNACIGSWVTAQHTDRLTGIIVDSVSGTPVEFAHIHNFSLNRQIYSNSSGKFTLDVRAGDTLVVYGIGYFYEKLVVEESMLSGNTVKIFLTQQPYNLSTANILGIGSYDQFRHKLINEPPQKTRTEHLNESLAGPVLSAAMEGFQEYKQEHPVIASIAIRTPEEKERIKLQKIMQEERVKEQVYHKFNPAIVKEITGLTEDDEIIEFMVFCNFSDSYIIEANAYDLAERIEAKYELYKKKKQEEKLKNDPVNFIDENLQPFACRIFRTPAVASDLALPSTLPHTLSPSLSPSLSRSLSPSLPLSLAPSLPRSLALSLPRSLTLSLSFPLPRLNYEPHANNTLIQRCSGCPS